MPVYIKANYKGLHDWDDPPFEDRSRSRFANQLALRAIPQTTLCHSLTSQCVSERLLGFVDKTRIQYVRLSSGCQSWNALYRIVSSEGCAESIESMKAFWVRVLESHREERIKGHYQSNFHSVIVMLKNIKTW